MSGEKVILGLVSVLVGWLLAQFTALAKDWLYRKKVAKCLEEELEEIQSELERTRLILARQLQLHAIGGIDHSVPVPLANHIFTNYYKDAVLGLNKHQRISFQLIHTLVGQANLAIEKFGGVTEEIQNRVMSEGQSALKESDPEIWGNHVKSVYEHVSNVIWHIQFHLSSPKSPELVPMSKEHEQYLQYLEGVRGEIERIMEGASNLTREQMETVYNPENFKK